MSEDEAKIVLEKMKQELFKRNKAVDDSYVSLNIRRMNTEFGGKWDNNKAQEYINSLAAEEDLREFANYTVEET